MALRRRFHPGLPPRFHVYATLDGVIDGEGNAAIERWQLPFVDEEFDRRVKEQVYSCGALLLGRKTYQGFAETWPTVTDEQGIADRLNSLPKHVASTTLTEPLAWNATLLKGTSPTRSPTSSSSPAATSSCSAAATSPTP